MTLPTPEDRHLDDRDLRHLLTRRLDADRRRRVLGHLLDGCAPCRARVRAELRLARQLPPRAAYDAAFQRAFARAGDDWRRELAEQDAGAHAWAALRHLPPGRRATLLLNSRRHQTPGVLEALFQDHREALNRDLGEALDLATLALALADRLDPGWRGPHRLADLRTAALVRAADANRLAGRHRQAAKLLARAARTQPQGTGEPLLEAELLTVAGNLWQALRRCERAARAFGRAEQVYREIGETHLAARSLVARAAAIGHHHPRHGIRLIRRALAEIDGALDPQLELTAHHNLAWYLNDAGRHREARAEIERSAALYHRDGGNVVATLSRAWLRGRIERALEHFDQARRSYGLAHTGFEELRMQLHLTMLAIDRAELQVADGDPAGAAALLASTLDLLHSWDISPDTHAILATLRQSVLARNCDRTSFRQAALAVRRRWARAGDDDELA
jgi:tetratricopeptide (TPR) repeat protein